MPPNSRFFTVPYASSPNPRTGIHSFGYWSLHDQFVLASPYAFRVGDVVRLVSIDESRRLINILPVVEGQCADSCFVFLSNDIPLSSQDTYEFEYVHCHPLFSHRAEHNGNQLYTFGLLVESDVAFVRGYSRAPSAQRLNFTINTAHR